MQYSSHFGVPDDQLDKCLETRRAHHIFDLTSDERSDQDGFLKSEVTYKDGKIQGKKKTYPEKAPSKSVEQKKKN